MMNLGVLADNAFTRFASKVALSDDERSVTFDQLNERTLRLGRALLDRGLEKGARIASLQYNSIEAIEFDVAAGRFGFVRTFLNARGSEADHEYSINHSRAQVLFYGAEFEEEVQRLRPRLESVEHFIPVQEPGCYGDLLARAQPIQPAYSVQSDDWHSIYYTSGSTGKPKGVVLTQRNWLVLIRNHLCDLYRRASADDVYLHAAPISHGSGTAIWSHLVRGARQHVHRRFDPDRVLAAIEGERVTSTFLAPTMIIKLLEADSRNPVDKSSLHSVAYGGAPMPVERVAEALRRWGPVFVQLYGQWEAPQIFTTLTQEQHAQALAEGNPARLASAGLPLTFTKVAIMSEKGELLPPDTEGEVVTSGDHLMVGYLDRPDATAAIRVGEWQRTGDIGRMDTDGYLYLVDRKGDVIVTGGSNVYPREIEEVLYQHEDVKEALAVGVPDDVWGERVHAIVVPITEQFSSSAFIEWCRERLGADKRPRSIELVEELPKSDYGKILRREVRERYWQGRSRKI